MKKLLVICSAAFAFLALTACEYVNPFQEPMPASVLVNGEKAEAASDVPEEPLPPVKPHITVITRDYNNLFGDMIIAGVADAAEKYGAVLTFEELSYKQDSATQAEILASALDKNPAAVCIAADDNQQIDDFLYRAKESGVALVGIDTGVLNAEPGLIASTAQTDNYIAGMKAAEALLATPIMTEKIRNAKTSAPKSIVILAPETENRFVSERIRGFLDKASERAASINQAGVQITDGDLEEEQISGAIALTVISSPDCEKAASEILQKSERIIGIFCASEEAANGLLDASSNGAGLDRADGIYKDLIVVGFDAGAKQKNAVKKQYFYGAIAQDPYAMGFRAIELAYDILQGDNVPETTDTGCKLYTYDNMGRKDIAQLLYD